MKQTIELPVGELKTALAGLNKIINPRSALPMLSCARISQEPGGGAVITATDLDNFVSCRLTEAQGGPFDPVLIPFEALSRQVRGMSSKDRLAINVSGEKAFFAFDLGGTRIEKAVETHPTDQWPVLPVIESKEIPLDSNFKTALNGAFECASDDSSRYVLNGAFVDVTKADAHYLVGTNGSCLYSANSFALDLPGSVILPKRKFMQWAGFTEDGDWRMAVRPPVQMPAGKPGDKPVEDIPGWAHISSSRWSLTTKLINGQYPNWRQVVPHEDDFKTMIRLTPEAVSLLQTVLPKLPGSDSPMQPVHLVVRPGVFTVRGFDKLSGKWTEVRVPGAEVSGKSNETTINRSYFLKALRFGLTEILLEDSLASMVFRAGGRQIILMPIRPDGASRPAKPAPAPNNPPQPEAAQIASPSATEPEITTMEPETKETMSLNTSNTPQTPHHEPASAPRPQAKPESEEDGSPFKAAMQEIDKLKELLRGAAGTLHTVVGLLKSAEREQKAAGKEVESVRAKLREIQSVKI